MGRYLFDIENKFNKNFALHRDLTLQARAIRTINVLRFILSLTFILFYLFIGQLGLGDRENTDLFFSLSLAYAFFSISLLVITPLKSSAVIFFHPVQIVIDIFFIVLMMHAAGGIQSGLGLLLIISIVTASLVSNGRLALFYAAVATIGLLLEQSYQIARWNLPESTYTQPVILSLSCFATAWLAYILAKRILQSEALASARGIDLENLAQVNALITQEIQDGVIVVDEDFNVRHHNIQAQLLLGFQAQRSDVLPIADCAIEITLAFKNWVNNGDSENHTIINIHHRELKLRFEPINHQDRRQGAVVFIQDWSLIQSASQQAKLAALGRLTANIAHEIRNPLSAISHANQLLQEEEQNSASNVRMLEIIADNIQRIEQIIKDVLELNRRDRTHQEKIYLDQFLVDFHHQFCAVEKIPLTYFSLSLLAETEVITFDQRHLTQILWNLCRNGWEHSQKQAGSLHLKCVKISESILNIEIIDDGLGVDERDRNKLFEPFYTTKTTGNGLGLYISRELAEANNAYLNYHSLDAGSAFILQLKNIH
ncbi:MAG: histidine kinase dimerization/phospho-acceptor domain-containing protein [Methylotenera sp.]|nr:histidine kinase dimerization/phospho-acceptor domain-containing protein [Methylotenera sp.]